MGFKILLSIVWLSVFGLTRFGVCDPSWVKTDQNNQPYNGQKVYADKDSSFTFDWRYKNGGYSLAYGKWTLVTTSSVGDSSKSQIIATQNPGENPKLSSKIDKNRITFSGGATMEIKNLQYPADQGIYECDLTLKNLNGDYKSLEDKAELTVVVPPRIIKRTGTGNDWKITIAEGSFKTLECAANGNPHDQMKIKWTKTTLDKKENTNLLDSYNHFGYNITFAQRKDIGIYKCEAIISVNNGKISHKDEYKVTVYVKHKPEVTSLSTNKTLTEGSNVELDCTATGDPPVQKYYWFKNKVGDKVSALGSGGKYTITSKGGSSKLVINSLDRKDSDWYYCAAENSLGIGNGTGTYVSALYAPTDVKITYIPNLTVNLTQPVTLKCGSDGVPDPRFTWKFKDNKDNSKEEDLDPKLQIIEGKNNEMVKISKMTKELTGEYTCKASNAHGSSFTKNTLHVNYKPEKAYFTTGLPKLGAIISSRTKLTCESDGYPKPNFIIKKYDGSTLTETTKDKDHILFDPVRLSDEKYQYTCTPFNFLGKGPETAKSRIEVIVPPNFIVGLKPSPKITRTENQTKNYTCIADAKPQATITWYINGDNVTYDKPYLGTAHGLFKPSQDNPGQYRTESTLVLDPVTWRHDGNISCIASNPGADPAQTWTLLEVKHRPVVKNPNEVPNNKTVNNGQDVTFTCFVVGNPATDSYRWRFNGQVISNQNTRTYTRYKVDRDDVGKYSCQGINSLGQGPWFTMDLLIKTPATITFHANVMANESSHATLICQAAGIPTPIIRWYRNDRFLVVGERLNLYNITYEDRGKYECRATNELNVDKAYVELIIQVKPNITSNKPTDTQIAGEIGNMSSLLCKVVSVPVAEIWWTRGIERTALKPSDERVVSINVAESARTLVIRVNRIGEDYYCHAKNLMGYAKQKYTIRKKGPPDAAIDVRLQTIKVPGKRTINVNVTWTAGYSGGYLQYFTVLYKLFSAKGFTSIVLDNAGATEYVIKDLKPHTKYVFQVQPRNEKGQGPNSDEVPYTTEASAVPPARGSMKVERIEDGTAFRISWTMNKNVTATYLQYREVTTTTKKIRARRNTDNYEYGRWKNVVGAQGLSKNTTSFVVFNLDKDKTYQFRILFKVGNEIGVSDDMAVESEIIQPLIKPAKRTGLKEDELIAIIAACGGFLLILIVVVCLCCFMKRKKGYGADSVQMSQTGSAPNLMSSYGDTGARGTNRRSYATESVEDDPFIDAHIANEMKKKRRPTENGINHGYASQGIRGGMSQSVGELGGRTSSYSSNGPQRDFSTLPPYHEPPSFEEAIRQSVKKSKYAALSTGDLTEEPRVHHGRSRTLRTPDSDTSDSEPPPMNRRPMFKVKPIDLANDKRYRSAPALPPLESPIRPGPRDPSQLYPRPQKKGPPPSYTPEDRAVLPGMDDGYEPRVTNRRPIADDVLELQEHPSYHRNDRLPDLPPSMPEFSRGRGMHKEPLGETLPEPPSFLRDLSYDEDEPDGRYQRSYTEPRHRTKQPYVNIHGQLVRPNSPGRQPTYGSDRQEPIYANDPPRLVAAEPEVPVERRNRQPSGSEEHKPGYVSSGFLV